MTAGRGIIHEEYHSDEFSKNGGTFEMCQLWLNVGARRCRGVVVGGGAAGGVCG